MVEITAAKAWSVATELNLDGKLAFKLDGNNIKVTSGTSPVEQLLAAVGSCFALTCSAVMQYHSLEPAEVHVSVWATKPAGPVRGKGLDRINIKVGFSPPIAKAKFVQIIRDAKSFCTVTNTLSREIDIAVGEVGDGVTE